MAEVVDEMPPVEAVRVPGQRFSELPKEKGPAWGRELGGEVRLSGDYRLAVYRSGEDYFLMEMVREGEGWRERCVMGNEGFDVVEGKLLELIVENTSP